MAPRTLLVVLAAAALLAVACGSSDDPSGGEPVADDAAGAGGEAEAGPRRTGGVALPEGPPPPLDTSSATVELADVHFDTFDGGSVPLSQADQATIDRLRDAIPPVTEPVYTTNDAAAYLRDDDLVLGYVTEGGEAYAWPIRILNFHEIVNEQLDGVPLLVTYCPLCRSGVVYDRRLDGRELTFGNTSALFESDLVMYDHQTNSYWWQVAGRAIVGELAGRELEPLASVTTTWGDWTGEHPDGWVLTTDTGFERPYDGDPFENYRASVDAGRFPFPVDERAASDDRLDSGEEVLGLVRGEEAVAFPLRTLGDAAVNAEVGGEPVVVFSQSDGPSGRAFDPVVDGRRLRFAFDGDAGGYVDTETGSTWDASGRAVAGELEGAALEQLPSRHAFWFAFVASFPDAAVAADADA